MDIKNVLGAKIREVVFSSEPEISDGLSPIEKMIGVPQKETNYEVDQGSIELVLDNGYILSFWNSEWGGMTVKGGDI